MTNEQLFQLLGETDESLLDENVGTAPAAPKRRWLRWTAAAAACVCLFAVGARVIPGLLPVGKDSTPEQSSGVVSSTAEIPTPPDPYDSSTAVEPYMTGRGITYQLLPEGADANDTTSCDDAVFTLFLDVNGNYAMSNFLGFGDTELGAYVLDGNTLTTFSSQFSQTTVFEFLETNTPGEPLVLRMVSSDRPDTYGTLVGRYLTARIDPDYYLTGGEFRTAELYRNTDEGTLYYSLTPEEMSQLESLLAELTVYQYTSTLPQKSDITDLKAPYDRLDISMADTTQHILTLYETTMYSGELQLVMEPGDYTAIQAFLDPLFDKGTILQETGINNFWVELENGIAYHSIDAYNDPNQPDASPAPDHREPIYFVLDPWAMRYQIIDPMVGGNAEVETGSYTLENGTYTLTSAENSVTILRETDYNDGIQWDFVVASCELYPDYAEQYFSSTLKAQKPFEAMASLTSATADDVPLSEGQQEQLEIALRSLTAYQDLMLPEGVMEEPVSFTMTNAWGETFTLQMYDHWVVYTDSTGNFDEGTAMFREGTAFLADAHQTAQLMAMHATLTTPEDTPIDPVEETTEFQDGVTTFAAVIHDITGNSVTVDGMGSLYRFTVSEDVLRFDKNGTLTLADFAVGDKVYVSYSGEVQETYPAQLPGILRMQRYIEE